MSILKDLFEELNKKTLDECHSVFLDGRLMSSIGIDPYEYEKNRQHFYSIEEFFEHEHILTKLEVFWFLCAHYYRLGGRWDERWLDAFARYDRLDCHFNQRFDWCNHSRIPEVREKFSDRLRKKKQNDDMKVYRTFKVRKGYAVRKGVTKLHNPDALIQEEGRGSSFSFSKILAYWFLNHHSHNYFYRTYGEVSDREEQRRLLKGDFPQWTDESIDEILAEDSYACVGTYSLKKKDILMVITSPEEEVVVDPNSIELVRYDFITYAESIAGSWAEDFKRKQDPRKYSWEIDEDDIFDTFLSITKRVYDSPSLLKSILHNEKNDEVRLWNVNVKKMIGCLSLDNGGYVIGKELLKDVGRKTDVGQKIMAE